MSNKHNISRRTFLGITGAAIGTAAIAANKMPPLMHRHKETAQRLILKALPKKP